MLSREQATMIRFADADPAGVIFYPRAVALAHAAVEDLIRHSSLGWEAWFTSPSHAAPLRHAEAEFFQPMRPGETFTSVAMVEKLGNTSVSFLVEFNDAQGRTAARIRTVHVLVDKGNGGRLPLTAAIRAAFDPPS
jgi:1,4-dihydroxy-2-naphthoyl-CoA hydrolase